MALVLLVEDNPMSLKLMRDILEIAFEVETASSAEDAMAQIEKHCPVLILTDLQLPGMDGLSFVRSLKQNPATAAIPVVAVSAHAMKESIDEAMAAGCVEYVTKPVLEDPYTFAARMKELLGASLH